MSQPYQRKKIAILGGGIASLTTAFELTSQPNWSANYDITIYQLGWRLGGKGASGRNVSQMNSDGKPTYRIEEHGLHIFFGFYANAFRLMKQAYDELGEDGPFSSIEDAFKPHSLVVLEQYMGDRWVHWPFDFPTNDLRPWDKRSTGSLWQHLTTLLKMMWKSFRESRYFSPTPSSGLDSLFKQFQLSWEVLDATADSLFLSIPNQLIQLLLQDPKQWTEALGDRLQWANRVRSHLDLTSDSVFLHLAYRLAESLLPHHPRSHSPHHHSLILKLIESFWSRFRTTLEQHLEQDDEALKLYILFDLALTTIRGLFADEVIYYHNLDCLDHLDYREWLRKHGAADISINSSFIRVLYDLVYAFPDGNPQNPQLAAGVALRILTTVLFEYDGAIMWKMQGGMGDVVFTPLYKVLKRRGVKFKFFHRVKELHLNEQKTAIDRISISRQVNLKNPEQDYDPLIRVKRLWCWPSEPDYDQIVEGEILKEKKINLESFWTPWQDVEEISLKAGKDFDLVVLGISLAALPSLCSELTQASPRWQAMFQNLKTVATQGGQFWLQPTLTQLGWPMASPVLGAYVEPLDTYADMSHLIERENWSQADYPYNIAYFTGVIPDPGIAPSSDHAFPAQVQQEINQQTINFFENQIGYLWPKATRNDNPQGLDWNLLVDPKNQSGQERFSSQYWNVGINPSERYVLAVPGSVQYRLKVDGSGFNHLYLAGDWVNNGYNSGCVEATVISGMQASRAILQQAFEIEYHKEVVGEWDEWLKP